MDSVVNTSWQTSRRVLDLSSPIIMGILNVTPDSFSDGGKYVAIDAALLRTEELINEGVGIIDVGGESTRPGSGRISKDEESGRVLPVIEAISSRFDIPISVDTSRSNVARRAVDVGAEIINDISGFRFDSNMASTTARSGVGVVLMHSRGDFETMHSHLPADDIFSDVKTVLSNSIEQAESTGVDQRNIVLDIGIGFGKTFEQNLQLLGSLQDLRSAFPQYPFLIGVSRKSFIGKILDGIPPKERLYGSLAATSVAVWNGASIIRTHDVAETLHAIKVAISIRSSIL